MNPPTTYAEWIRLLDALKAGTDDDAVLPALMAGRLHWQSGVAERFTRVLGEVLDARLQRLGDKLQRDLDRARGNEAGVVRALADARKGFGLLLRVSELPALPAEVRAALGDAVRRALEQTQSSLEGSARADRSGRLSSILRRYPLTVQPDQETPPPSPPVPPGRRLLIGRE